jgi:hypothetical protein
MGYCGQSTNPVKGLGHTKSELRTMLDNAQAEIARLRAALEGAKLAVEKGYSPLGIIETALANEQSTVDGTSKMHLTYGDKIVGESER